MTQEPKEQKKEPQEEGAPNPEQPAAGSDAYELVSSEFAKQAREALEQNYKDKLLRLRADFDNYRKRMQKERDDAVRYAHEELIAELLPVLDHFELGMKAASTAKSPQDIVQGMNMVLAQFQKMLADVGVKEIDAVGQPFDPHQHEAVGHEVNDAVPEGTIISQSRKGYKIHDRLLRPSSVIVAQSPNSTPN